MLFEPYNFIFVLVDRVPCPTVTAIITKARRPTLVPMGHPDYGERFDPELPA